MNVAKRLEAKDSTVRSQFSRFILVGGISTIINYSVFYALFSLGYNYLIASAVGYIVGAVFGYVFNARLTFKKKAGLSVIPYFSVYTFSLVTGLGVLKFFASSLNINPLLANLLAIGYTTMTNFLGSRYIAFNEKFRLPPFFTSRIFLFVLSLKLVFAFFFASEFLTNFFVPFVKYFVANPLSNPYQHFFDAGMTKTFPYPPLMLYILSVPYILLGIFGGPFFDIFAARLPLITADIAVFYVLYSYFRGREKYSLLFYWASPVVFYVTYIHGQLDLVPVAFLFFSVYFLVNRRYLVSAALLGAGLATKSFVFVALPLFAVYIIKKRVGLVESAGIILASLAVYAVLLMPFVFSSGFLHMVFLAEEQFRIFNLSVPLSQSLIYYILPAAYAYIIFKSLSYKKITREILFVLIGLTLTFLVTFINPARGWYVWVIPFMVYFFVKERLNFWLYAMFNVFYLLYFAFIPESDIFSVFSLISPGIAAVQTPYDWLLAIRLPANLIVNILFTALTSILLYSSYLIYTRGMKNSLLFQEKNGIPMIGISGDSGTGKTNLALSLSGFFGKSTIVYGDDLHKWERGDENWQKYTHLNPIGNRVFLNYRQIKRLKLGNSIFRPHYSHITGKFSRSVKVKPGDLIISEGLHTFFINESNDIYELKIYMDPDPSLRAFWKIKRDVKKRGYNIKDVLKQLKRREADAEKFISPQKYYSDVIVSFRPTEKITLKKDLSDLGKTVPAYLEIDVRNDFPIEDLIQALSSCVSISTEYPDHRFQRIRIEGMPSRESLVSILDGLGIDYESYEMDKNGIKGGPDGVLQIMILYCLNHRLKMISGADYYE